MTNIINQQYETNGRSTSTDAQGMRDMQVRAYARRAAQYLLIKAPPASGKSRALMFLALHKLKHQGLRKAIVSVPECTIGKSFAPIALTETGFFADWSPEREYNLCTPDADNSSGKIAKFKEFMAAEGHPILICTHATLRFAFDQLEPRAFNNTLLAIDEFHHVSADRDTNKLGQLVHEVMTKSDAHIIAMTGSYFRGDNVPVLLPSDEANFERVVYSYYDQLNGYKYLKSLGIGHHFYQGSYLSALPEILDTTKKTIIHIPNVNSGESPCDKREQVGQILDVMGTFDHQDEETGIIYVKTKDGRMLKIADLVEDANADRRRIEAYLETVQRPEDLDIIIALNKAKEGFDWPMCEHALTVGYRASLTEIIQIIGRATRDYPGKEHTQFTNLIAAPAATDDEVTLSVNNMLKAITASLLMEQVLAPDMSFLNRASSQPGNITVRGFKEPSTERVREIVENDLTDLTASILQDDDVRKAIANPTVNPLMTNRVLIPRIIQERYPDLSNIEVEEVRQRVILNNFFKHAKHTTEKDKSGQSKQFININKQWITVNDIDINLIDTVNPFQDAFEIISKQLSSPVFRVIRDAIETTRVTMTPEEAYERYPYILAFKEEYGRIPEPNPNDPNEALLYEALLVIQKKIREEQQKADGAND